MIDPFEEFGRRKAAPIQFNDFDIPFAPLSRNERQITWQDDFFASPPEPMGGKGLPEYAVIQPESIMSAVESIATSFDKGLGVFKQFVPGLGGVGDWLGDIGAGISAGPAGPSLDSVRELITKPVEDAAVNTVKAVGNRLGQIGAQIGWTFDEQNPDSFKILDAPFRVAGAAIAGKTGARAFDFGITGYDAEKEFANLGEDLLETANIAAIIPAVRGVLIGAKAISSAGTLGLFLKGMATPIVKNTQAERVLAAGRIAGRLGLLTSATGLTADFVLPKIAPDAPWAKDILDNRIVAMNSPWRFPVELATTLPLDLFAMTKFVGALKPVQATWRKVHGTPKLPSQIVLGDKTIERLTSSKLASIDDITSQDDHWFRQYAEEHAVKVYNLAVKEGLPEAKRISDIRIYDATSRSLRSMSQPEAAEFIRNMDTALIEELGPSEYGRRAAQVWQRELDNAGLAYLSDEQKIIHWQEYAELARVLEKNKGMSVQVASDVASQVMQAQAALGYLDNVKALGFQARTDMTVRYPSLVGEIENATKDELVMRLQLLLKNSPAPEYIKIGQMEALLDDAARKGIVDEVQKLKKDIAGMRDNAAKHWVDRIDFLKNARFAREGELNLKRGDIPDAAMDAADSELARIDHLLEDAQIEYAKAFLAGSRWELQHQPGIPIMRVIDTLGRDLAFGTKGVARLGQLYETLFGPIPNVEIGRKTYQAMQESFLRAGNTNSTIKNFYENAHKFVLDNTQEYSTGFARSRYVTIYHIPADDIDRIARESSLKIPQGKTAHQVLYEAWPGPFRFFQERVAGRSIKIPYNRTFANFTRSTYPMFRFFYSPRFLALNLGEPRFISAFLGRRGLKPSEEFIDIAEAQFPRRATAAIQSGEDLFGESGTVISKGQTALATRVAQVAWTRRMDEVTDTVLRVVARHPAMEDLLKTMGTQEKWVEFLDNTVQGRLNTLNARNAVSELQKSLADDIKNIKADLAKKSNAPLAPELMTRLRMKEDRFIKSITDMQTAVDENGKAMLRYERYRPFINAMKIREEQLIKDMRMHYIGNTSRSATERLLNSFMLYWPLSYQLKASRIMLEMAFSRGFGLRTGSTVADSWLQLRRWHEKEITEQPDGEWAELHRRNRHLIFIMRQFVPVTPEDMGTRLSGLTTTPYKVFTGELSAQAGWSRVTNVGPVYDIDLMQRVITEESSENGLFYDLFQSRKEEK